MQGAVVSSKFGEVGALKLMNVGTVLNQSTDQVRDEAMVLAEAEARMWCDVYGKAPFSMR